MREIKFRGKAAQHFETSQDGVEKGDWVYGHYCFCRQRMSGIIITMMCAESGGVGSGLVQVEIEVDHKTVGQYIGRKDKNGKGIYEDDLLGHRYYSSPVMIEFKNGSFISGDVCITDKSLEVIGNKHDNPSLLAEL